MKREIKPRPDGSCPSDFNSPSDWRGAIAIIGDLALISGAAYLSILADHWAIYLLSVWFIGLIQLGLGEMLTHEANHSNLFKSRRLNRWSQFFCCYPFFFTLEDYRKEHTEHHRLLNSDQERLYLDYADHGLLAENRNMIWLWFFKPVLGYGAYAYIKSLFLLATPRSALKLLAFWAPLLTLAIWGHWLDLLILYWLVPMLWCFSSFFYWSEIEDHYNTISGTRTNISWTNWLTHNNGYHYVHHRYPKIPFFNLKKAHRALCSGTSDISRGFFDTFFQISDRASDFSNRKTPEGMPQANS